MAAHEPLYVTDVFMYEQENAVVHHTDKFELVQLDPPNPVLRRGQPFNMALRFNRDYNDDTDIVRLFFTFGTNTEITREPRDLRSHGHKKKSFMLDLERWPIRMRGYYGTDISIEVTNPYISPVGIWQLNIETTMVGWTGRSNTYSFDRDIYLLFNPWLKDDPIYMEDTDLLEEYILNDVGKIWVGPWGSCRGREWVFGQFDACILPACQAVLERSGLKENSWGDPIRVARAISKIVNSNDDKGVVMGRWDGQYDDGTPPSGWTGSSKILEQYYETGQEVKYGQCWVFAGVVTTICRALGIPSRVVSNLVSAHDANETLSVDRYYDINNDELNYDPFNVEGTDSIWNYHVWNDVWMLRPDLPKGYGGWQAIDATPQEKSDGVYQCGPTSVEAIRQGAVGFNYDVPFMLASVNADLMRWKEDPNSELGFSKIECDKYHVGRMILTKAPFVFDHDGDSDKEDITYIYKNKEGTNEERLTLYRGVRGTEMAKKFYSLPPKGKEDVIFELEDIERVSIGMPFSVVVNITNTCNEERTINAILTAGSVFYTGVKAHNVKRASGKFLLAPNTSEQLRLRVNSDEYMSKLVEYCNMKLYAIATVAETSQTWADEDDFQVLKPNIDVKINDDVLMAGRPISISLSFKNPLEERLTNCQFNFSGGGIRNITLQHQEVEPLEMIYVEHTLVSPQKGSRKIVATFTANELVDITGCATIEVADEESYIRSNEVY